MIDFEAPVEEIISAVKNAEKECGAAVLENVKSEIAALGAVDTGRLLASAAAEENTVSVSAPYAGYVEYGTSKMAAKPFMTLALYDSCEEALLIIGRAVSEVIL